MIEARFGHVNLVAGDWRRLADFYIRVLGCEFVPPERDMRGPILQGGTGIAGAALRGAHLRLPGGGPQGPTLEIFQYESGPEAMPTAANRPGFGHIAFVVPDVAEASATFLAEGGRAVGQIVTSTTADGRQVTWTYVADPEGNIVELQAWASAPGQPDRR